MELNINNPAATDLSGMSQAVAKEYILNFITTLKLTEKQIQAMEEDISKWRKRAELANSNTVFEGSGSAAQPELAMEAEKELNRLLEKQSTLKTEAELLTHQIDEMRRQIPLLAARERSIDPILLEQELLIAAGYNPGDEEKARVECRFKEMEKNHAADAALEELKIKMDKHGR